MPFQTLGIIRWALPFCGRLACLGLFSGARRRLGSFGGAAAVGVFCSSGAAVLFAWRDYMPTFTDASLIAAGTGALLWTVLAAEATAFNRCHASLTRQAATAVPRRRHAGAVHAARRLLRRQGLLPSALVVLLRHVVQ